jgi:hypothetical protein
VEFTEGLEIGDGEKESVCALDSTERRDDRKSPEGTLFPAMTKLDHHPFAPADPLVNGERQWRVFSLPQTWVLNRSPYVISTRWFADNTGPMGGDWALKLKAPIDPRHPPCPSKPLVTSPSQTSFLC